MSAARSHGDSQPVAPVDPYGGFLLDGPVGPSEWIELTFPTKRLIKLYLRGIHCRSLRCGCTASPPLASSGQGHCPICKGSVLTRMEARAWTTVNLGCMNDCDVHELARHVFLVAYGRARMRSAGLLLDWAEHSGQPELVEVSLRLQGRLGE